MWSYLTILGCRNRNKIAPCLAACPNPGKWIQDQSLYEILSVPSWVLSFLNRPYPKILAYRKHNKIAPWGHTKPRERVQGQFDHETFTQPSRVLSFLNGLIPQYWATESVTKKLFGSTLSPGKWIHGQFLFENLPVPSRVLSFLNRPYPPLLGYRKRRRALSSAERLQVLSSPCYAWNSTTLELEKHREKRVRQI